MALRVRERYQRLSSSLDHSRGRRALRLCKQNALLISTAVSVVAAVLVGVIISLCSRPDRVAILCVSLPGEVFLSLLQLLVVPLIVLSIVTGIGNMKLASSGALGWRVLAYYASTTVFASVLGVVLAVSIQPGHSYQTTGGGGRCLTASAGSTTCRNITAVDTVADLIRCVCVCVWCVCARVCACACLCACVPVCLSVCLSDLDVFTCVSVGICFQKTYWQQPYSRSVTERGSPSPKASSALSSA